MKTNEQVVNSNQKRWLTGGLIFLLTIFVLHHLGELFPDTGLSIIVAYPLILFLNGLIILTLIQFTKNLQRLRYRIVWTVTTIFTTLIAIILYPQGHKANVFKQIGYSFSAIRHFDDSPITDLDLPFSVDDFSWYDCKIKDSEERYIVALYKYRQTIPLDGSFHILRQEKTGTDLCEKTSIKSIEEIPNKFITGQDKLIWWTLELLEK
jgi:hypothetical protein